MKFVANDVREQPQRQMCCESKIRTHTGFVFGLEGCARERNLTVGELAEKGDIMIRTPADEYQKRIGRIETAMADAGLDALIAYSAGNEPGPVAYVGGYSLRFGLNDTAYFVVVPGTNPTYALFGNAYWDKPPTQTWTTNAQVTRDFDKGLLDVLPPTARRVGIVGYSFFPTPTFAALRTALPETQFEDATGLVMKVASIKSPAEVELVRRASQMSDAGGRAFLNGVREGKYERELQADVDHAMIAAGADGLAFPTFIMSGVKVGVGIGFAQDRALVRGEQVNVLCGAKVDGYRVELGRVTTVGAPSDDLRRIMETAADMHQAMQEACKPGVTGGQIADASVGVARKQNLDQHLFKSINNAATQGHGMGCWVNEPPPINPLDTTVIKENMTLSLEARLCLPDGRGAVITEMVLVTPSGIERFSEIPLRTWG